MKWNQTKANANNNDDDDDDKMIKINTHKQWWKMEIDIFRFTNEIKSKKWQKKEYRWHNVVETEDKNEITTFFLFICRVLG